MSSLAAEVSNSSPFEPSSSTSANTIDNSESSSSSSASNSVQNQLSIENSLSSPLTSSGSSSTTLNPSIESQTNNNMNNSGVASTALTNANFTAIPYLTHYLYPFQSESFLSATDLIAPSPASSASSNQSQNDAHSSHSSMDEPEMKKVKLSHYQYVNLIQNLKQSNSLFSYNAHNTASASTLNSVYSGNSIFMVHKKLEERIGGILCCTVCLGMN